MSLRRTVTAATTILVAIALAILVPVAQLQTVASEPACCCPNPETCKCPQHKPGDPLETTLRSCHDNAPVLAQAQLSAFVPPTVPSTSRPSHPIAIAATMLADPHSAPALRRPDAPS